MFPIGDDDSARRSVPIINYLIIIANVIVFLLELNRGDAFIQEWAFYPRQFIHNPVHEFPTIFSSMFMHGGWMHIIGNMIYLWTFGDNVEDQFGHIPYLLFYLVCGVAAMAAQTAFMPNSNIPNVGASGAIAGVLGAYILMFPQGRISILTNAGIIQMPALVAIGFWIVLQFFSVIGSFADTAQTGGVAYMAHIGGFIAGLVLTLLFGRNRASI